MATLNKLGRVSTCTRFVYSFVRHRQSMHRPLQAPFLQRASFVTENTDSKPSRYTLCGKAGIAIGGLGGSLAIMYVLYNKLWLQQVTGRNTVSEAIQLEEESIWNTLTSDNRVEISTSNVTVNRATKCQSAAVIESYLKPALHEYGLGALTGSHSIGTTVVCKQIYNKIKNKSPHLPMAYIDLGDGRTDNLPKTLNISPKGTLSQFSEDAFIDAMSELRVSIIKHAEELEIFYPPVIVLDGIDSVPDLLWQRMAYFAKEMTDSKIAKVIFVGSGEVSRQRLKHRKLIQRGIVGRSHEVCNSFDAEDLAKCFGLGEKNDFTRILLEVTDGRIGFAQVILNFMSFPNKGDLNEEERKSTREKMLDGLFEMIFKGQFQKVGKQLQQRSDDCFALYLRLLASDDIIKTLREIPDDDIPQRRIKNEVFDELTRYNIIKGTLANPQYDSYALEQTIRNQNKRHMLLHLF